MLSHGFTIGTPDWMRINSITMRSLLLPHPSWPVRALLLSSVTLVPAARAAKLALTDGVPGDHFGISISLLGNTALVGAEADDADKGSAFLFRDLDTAIGIITESAKLTASDRMENDSLGHSVSLWGNTALIGAYDDDGIRGSAYFFRRLDTAAGTITEDVKLTASERAGSDYFGYHVSLWGDTALAGAYGDDSNRGAAYLFRNLGTATGSITENVKLTASDGAAGDYFGSPVCLLENTALIGASMKDSHRGAAYLFRSLGSAPGTATEAVKLHASDGVAGDYFGSPVSLFGTTALIGAYGRDSGKGSVYFFRDLGTASGTVTESVRLAASDGVAGDYFGGSVSLQGGTALVGVEAHDFHRGAAYLFLNLDTATGTVMENVKLTASDGGANDYFGASVALDGGQFLIGAMLAEGSTLNSGSVHTGRVSTFTIMDDAGGVTRATDGLSFVSQDDWVIGQSTDGNRNTLSAGDSGSVSASGMAVYVGRAAGADNNLLTVNGALSTNALGVGTEGNTGNVLRLNGTLETAGEVSVAAGSGIGGTGTLTGSLKLEAGAFLEFAAAAPLKVHGNVTLDPGFGIAHLRGLDSGVPEGTYPLIGGAVADFNAPGIANLGAANAYELGGGKFAWFARRDNGLQLVVAGLPALNLGPADGQLRLNWTTPFSGLILETSTTLTGVWQTVDTAPSQNGNDFTVTLPLSGGRAFYRLRKP